MFNNAWDWWVLGLEVSGVGLFAIDIGARMYTMTLSRYIKNFENWVDCLLITACVFALIAPLFLYTVEYALICLCVGTLLLMGRNTWQFVRLIKLIKTLDEPIGSMNMIDYSHYQIDQSEIKPQKLNEDSMVKSGVEVLSDK